MNESFDIKRSAYNQNEIPLRYVSETKENKKTLDDVAIEEPFPRLKVVRKTRMIID
jgi:hypothetical protein